MKRKRETEVDGVEAEIDEGSKPDGKKKKSKKKSKSENEEPPAPPSEPQHDPTELRDNGSAPKSKKGRENDPDRLWKREKVRREYAMLQSAAEAQAGGEGTSKSSAAGVAEASLQYLKQWKEDRGSWSFRKVRQVWLLKNMYDKTQVSKGDFKILLLYLDGLKGASRQITLEAARHIVEASTSEDEEDDSEAAANVDAAQHGAGNGEMATPKSAQRVTFMDEGGDGEGDGDGDGDGDEDEDGAEDGEETDEEAKEERRKQEQERRAKARAKARRVRMKRATQILRQLS